jgi:hypothetical protein
MLVDLCDQKRVRDDQIYNYLHQNGIVKKRVEFYTLPTVERERLLTKDFTSMTDRLPDVTHAIKVGSQNESETLLVKHGKLGVYTTRIDDWMEDLSFDFSEYQVSFGLDFVKLVKSIVNETSVHEHFFFANTNDFVNKVRIHSKIYNHVDDGTKKIINDILSQPLFRICDAKTN